MNTSMLQINEMPIGFIKVADSFLERFKGLMLCDPQNANYVLALSPCKQIHTFFMRFPIDVVFCDKGGRVLEVHRNIEPWKVDGYVLGAHIAFEALSDTFLKDVQVGDVIHF